MKRFVRIATAVLLLLALLLGVLYVAFPANRTQVDGPADPILVLRRAAFDYVKDLGVNPLSWFGGDDLVPTQFRSETGMDGPDGVYVAGERTTVVRELVFRGIFWPVGDRITYQTENLDGTRSRRRALRLFYLQDGKRALAGESNVAQGTLDATGQRGAVRGYVPRSATAYWIDEVDENGVVSSRDGWGDVDQVWQD